MRKIDDNLAFAAIESARWHHRVNSAYIDCPGGANLESFVYRLFPLLNYRLRPLGYSAPFSLTHLFSLVRRLQLALTDDNEIEMLLRNYLSSDFDKE